MIFQSESPGGSLKTKGSNPTTTNGFFLCLIFLSAETNCFLRVVSVGNETLARSSGACRLLCRVYVVGENMEILKVMEKSENNFFKLLKTGRGLGNSFSASLKCLNFEMFW